MSERRSPPPGAPEEQALWWVTQADDRALSAAEEAALDAWLAADPQHATLHDDARAFWNAAGEAGAAPEIAARAEAALARSLAPPRRRAPLAQLAAAAAALVMVLAAGATVFLNRDLFAMGDPNAFETEIGEQSAVTLDDGSVVTLNTASRVAVDFSGVERRVTLERGQALFEVAKDASRPFVVTAGDKTITALGTAFDVRLEKDAGVQVTLLEGSVAIKEVVPEPVARPEVAAPVAALPEPMARPAPMEVAAVKPTILAPGQQLVAEPTAPPVVRVADVSRVMSWREGRLVFETDTLADAVAEVNRYARRPIVLGDDRLENLRVSGVFSASETERFVAALTATFPVEVDEEARAMDRSRIRLVWRE